MNKRLLCLFLSMVLCLQLHPALMSHAAEAGQAEQGSAETVLPLDEAEETAPAASADESTESVLPIDAEAESTVSEAEDMGDGICTTPCVSETVSQGCPEATDFPVCKEAVIEGAEEPEETRPQSAVPAAETGSDPAGDLWHEEVSASGNVVTTYINEDEGNEERTIHWAEGVNPPKMGGPAPDFKKEETNQGGRYIEYVAPYEVNKGWYDANKHRPGDQNLCFVAATANALQWWMDRNHEHIQQYLDSTPEYYPEKRGEIESILNKKDVTQHDGLIYKKYFEIFKDRPKGYWADLLIAHFINGYPIDHDDEGMLDPDFTDGENLLKNGPDSHGGFFFDVFKQNTLCYRYQNVMSFRELKDLLKEIDEGKLLMLTHATLGNNSHIITLWGVEYDQAGNPVAVYYTDSDDLDRVEAGMRRYKLFEKNGKPYITTNAENAGGSLVTSIHTLSQGDPQKWAAVIRPSVKEITVQVEELVYNGKEQTPAITSPDIQPDHDVKLIATGKGTLAGTYDLKITMEGKDKDKYKLPADLPGSFEIKKAIPTIELQAAAGADNSISLSANVIGAENQTLEGTITFTDDTQVLAEAEVRDNAAIYTLTSPAIGHHNFKATFTPKNETAVNYESADSIVVSLEHHKAEQAAPQALTVQSVTENSVVLTPAADNSNGAKAEYSMDNGVTWQDSPSFAGLKPGTAYTFHARYKETTAFHPSEKSQGVTAYTLPAIMTDILPNGKAGERYEYTLTADAAAGATVVWNIEGSLPAGLTLDPNSGTISGIPTAATTGPASFTVKATVNGVSQSRQLTITVDKAPAKAELTPSADTLHGGGEITLTLTGLPAGVKAEITCSDASIKLTPSGDNTWKVSLPNVSKTYTFTMSYMDANTGNPVKAVCEVAVTQSSDGNGTLPSEPDTDIENNTEPSPENDTGDKPHEDAHTPQVSEPDKENAPAGNSASNGNSQNSGNGGNHSQVSKAPVTDDEAPQQSTPESSPAAEEAAATEAPEKQTAAESDTPKAEETQPAPVSAPAQKHTAFILVPVILIIAASVAGCLWLWKRKSKQ